LLVCPDDAALPDLSNALDLNLRPLCLVLPAAPHVSAIALRATLSLLKSRLARAAADAEGPAWTYQRRRLAAHDELWRHCLAWSRRDMDDEAWPTGLETLFPVRILPQSLAARLTEPSDWVILTAPSRLPAELCLAWPGAQRTLALTEAAGGSLAGIDPAARQRAELEVLTQELSELELELATAHAEIADFTGRYHALIGTRMAMLDELRAELAARQADADTANTEACEAAAAAHERAEQTRRESSRFEEIVRAAAATSKSCFADSRRGFTPTAPTTSPIAPGGPSS
jgi:hypothetical protein